MRWRNTGDIPPIPSDLGSLNSLFEAPRDSEPERDREVYHRRRDGKSYAEIAAEFNLTATEAREIVQEIAEAIRRFHEARRSG